MNKLFLTMILLVAVLCAPAMAQSSGQGITFVDVATATVMIDTLSKENDTMNAEIVKLQKDIVDARATMTKDRKTLADVSDILDSVKAKSAQIMTMLTTVNDKDTKAQLSASLERNLAVDKKLSTKVSQLNAEIASLQDQSAKAVDQISINNAKIGRNKDAIIVLTASVDKTKQQQAQVAAYVKDVEAFLATSEAYQVDPPKATAAATTAKP